MPTTSGRGRVGGLVAFGFAVWFAADRVVEFTIHPGAVAAVHLGVLAFLTTAVLGSLHQLAPLVGRRPLRSVPAARLTFVGMVATAWLLPSGFAHGPESLVRIGAAVGAVTVLLAAWNLSGPLGGKGGGPALAGLRCSVPYLVLTVAFGAVYAFDRQAGWFPLYPHRVLAHAHLGLLGWLGLTYVAIAEKLWPMFLMSDRPRARAGAWAVGLVATGVPVLGTGLLFAVPALAWPGGIVVTAGLLAHLVSQAGTLRYRRRSIEVLHGFLFAAAAFLVAAVALGGVAALGQFGTEARARLVAAEVAALVAWLALATIGHAHKVVPFLAFPSLRAPGVTAGPGGAPLRFDDLFHLPTALLTLLVGGAGFAVAITGILVASAAALAVGGVLVAATGVVAGVNLGLGPRRARRFEAAVPVGGPASAHRATV